NAAGAIHVLDNGRTVRARLSGPRLDVSGRFAHQSGATRPATAAVADASGPAWVVDAKFNALALARGRLATNLRLHAEGAGDMMRAARLSARTGAGKPVEVSISPDRGGRVLRASAADGGTLLRDLGATDSIQGGRLSVSARYLDQRSGHPLSGVAEMDDFTVHGAPVLAKVLQAVTLYGLVQAVEGPGMSFNHLAAPFVYGDGVLELDDARAFNASLGLTAKGRVDFDRERMDVEGTIVPAYYVNTALGHIPLIGRLFSPEKGGGVFAARYSAQGSLDDPAVRVNPLSALTPGFLRGLFGR
ncbi:MAG: AsmA-like C-terminal region-containing protein, partial [Acetobacteraceae bacterium]